MKGKVKSFVVSIVIALAVGGISALISSDGMDIYSEFLTPPLTPPGWLFPIVWSVLFVLMGISAALVYTEESVPLTERLSALAPYAVSLFFNFFWSIIFFNFRAFLFAFVWLLLLLFFILKTILAYRPISPLAAYLQIPYLLWVAFAGYLNFGIWYLN